MVKTRWVRNAAVFGTAVTLSLASVSLPVNEGSAASFCQETEMVSLSLSLDKFYTVNYANADSLNGVGSTPAPAPAAADNAEPAALPTAEPEKKAEEKSEGCEEKRKKKQLQSSFVI